MPTRVERIQPAAVEKLPGLVSAVKGGRFQPHIRTELSELYAVTQQAQTRYILLAKRSTAAPLERAEFVLGEIKATLHWHFEDGETSDEDIVLAQLAETHGSAQSHDGIAAALFDYAELADRKRRASHRGKQEPQQQPMESEVTVANA